MCAAAVVCALLGVQLLWFAGIPIFVFVQDVFGGEREDRGGSHYCVFGCWFVAGRGCACLVCLGCSIPGVCLWRTVSLGRHPVRSWVCGMGVGVECIVDVRCVVLLCTHTEMKWSAGGVALV